VDRPTTNDQQPTTNNQQPTTNNQQPTTNNQQPTTNNQQPATEELKYSRNRARRHQCPTNNLLKVWQSLAPFGGRPIGAAVEVLLAIVLIWQLSGDHQYCWLFFT
jgi:hypothetical protein